MPGKKVEGWALPEMPGQNVCMITICSDSVEVISVHLYMTVPGIMGLYTMYI